MSSADQSIIKSVDVVIGAIKALENEIRRAPDVDPDVKVQALQKMELVSDSLKDIHTTFYIPDELKTSLDFSGDEASVTDLSSTMISALSVLGDGEPAEAEPLSETDEEELLTATTEEKLNDEVVEEAGDVAKDAAEEEENDPVGMRLVVRPQSDKSEKADKTPEEAALEDGVDMEARGEPEDQILQTDIVAPKVNNLLLIMGIDEKIESLLNDYDIFRFEDIAGFQEADVVRISKLLDDPARVSRENWIEQASLLAQDMPTKFAQQSAGIELFDRMSLVGSYHEQSSQEKILEDVPVFDLPEYGPVQEQEDEPLSEDGAVLEDEVLVAGDPLEDVVASAPLPVDSISREKQLLEAELASLRLELAERTAAVEQKILDDAKAELDAEFDTSDEALFEEVSSSELSARLQNAFAGPLTSDEFDEAEAEDVLQDETPDLKLDIPLIFDVDEDQQIVLANEDDTADMPEAEVGDGAMWHDEVSTSADYVPPVIGDMDEDFEADEPASFDHEGELKDVADNGATQNGSGQNVVGHLDDDYLDSSDISVPQDNLFVNEQADEDNEPAITADNVFEDGVFANGLPPLPDAVPPVLPAIFGDALASEGMAFEGLESRDEVELEAPLLPPVPLSEVPVAEDVLSGNQVTQQDQMALAEMAQAMDMAQDGDMALDGADPLFDVGVSRPLGAYLAGQSPVVGVEEQSLVSAPDFPVTQLIQNGPPSAPPVRALGASPNGLPPMMQNGAIQNGPPIAPPIAPMTPATTTPMRPLLAAPKAGRPPQAPVMPPHAPSVAPVAGVGFPPRIQQVPHAPQIPQTRRVANGEPPLQVAGLQGAELQRAGPNNLLPPVQRSKRPGERDNMAGDRDHHMPRYQKESREPQVSAGFKLKAKQFSESLQRSFVSEED